LKLESPAGETVLAAVNIRIPRLHPALYLLALPLRYTTPDFLNDGGLTLAAKFDSMAANVNRYPENAVTVFDIFSTHINSKNSGIVSTCLKTLGTCFNTLLEVLPDAQAVFRLAKTAIFTPTTNWYQASYIIHLIRIQRPDHYGIIFGYRGIQQAANMMVDFCLWRKDQVWMQARNALTELADGGNFEWVTNAIVFRMDFIACADTDRLLAVLGSLIQVRKDLPIVYLRVLVFELLELIKMQRDDLAFAATAFEFLSCFDLGFLDAKRVKSCVTKAVRMIAATTQLFTGEEWPDPQKSMQKTLPIVEHILSGFNIDIESSLNYESFSRPLYAAHQLILALPAAALDRGLIDLFITKLLPVFPLLVVKLFWKCWGRLVDDQQAEILKKAISRLRYTRDFEMSSILCQLFIQLRSDQMPDACEQLTVFARYALDHAVGEQYHAIFQAFLYFIRGSEREKVGESRRQCGYQRRRLSPHLEIQK
jgi:hypothetical protein